MAKVRRQTPSKARAERHTTLDDISLPGEANEPPTSLEEVIVTIFGRKNIGKSSLAALFEGAVTFMFERGRRNLSIFQIPKKGEPDLDWVRFRAYRDLICGSSDFVRPVFDTIERAYECCFQCVCREHGVTHPDEKDKPYLLWNAIKYEFEEVVNSFKDAGKPPIFVSHEKLKPLIKKAPGLRRDGMEESTIKYDRIEPSISGQALAVIEEICDYVFYYGYKDGKRTITVRSPLDIIWTACGMGDETFRDPDNNPVECFAVGNSAEEAYKTVLAAFNNQIRDIDYIPPSTRSRDVSLGKKTVKKAVRRK